MEEKKVEVHIIIFLLQLREIKNTTVNRTTKEKILVDQQRGRVKEEFVLLYHVTRRFTD